MPNLFPNFLEDEAEYQAAESYWKVLWSETPSQTVWKGWSEPWLITSFLNGKKFLDGDPIFSAISKTDRLAVRVIQHEPTSEDLDIDFWIDSFDTGDLAVDVLVINCALSDASAQYSAYLLRSWLLTGKIVLTSNDGRQMSVAVPDPEMKELLCA
jgi:hypothetical protein